jgi:hypothetical protein
MQFNQLGIHGERIKQSQFQSTNCLRRKSTKLVGAKSGRILDIAENPRTPLTTRGGKFKNSYYCNSARCSPAVGRAYLLTVPWSGFRMSPAVHNGKSIGFFIVKNKCSKMS